MKRTMTLAIGLICMARIASAQTVADSAWVIGDIALAERLYEDQLGTNPNQARALHRLALILAWSERYDESLKLFDRLLILEPGNLEAAAARAKVFAWRGEVDVAIAAFRRLASDHPDNADVRLGLAEVLSWDNQLDEAESVYEQVLEDDSNNRGALAGRAKVSAWSDRLVEAEALWREALARFPDDPVFLTGLGQTLRWQGRDAAALEYLEPALELTPQNRDLRTEARLASETFLPRGRPAVLYESDSDGNRIGTARYQQALWPDRRLGVRVSGYARTADQVSDIPDGSRSGRAFGAFGEAEYFLEPGWRLVGGLGASVSDVQDSKTMGAYRLSVETPSRHPVIGTVSLNGLPLDETAQLMETGVHVVMLEGSVRATPASGWRATMTAGTAGYSGSETNRRLSGSVGVDRRLSGAWLVGVSLRAFGFEKNLNDGYFDPEFYGIGELWGAWTGSFDAWELNVSAAPGVQQVKQADYERTSMVGRASASVGCRVRPSSEIILRGMYSSTGLNTFATGSEDYRYFNISVLASIAF